MKKLLLATTMLGFAAPAMAADMRMPVKAPPPAVAAVVYNWTGIFVGAHVGYGWGDAQWRDVLGGQPTQHDIHGFLGGGHVGVQFQTGRFILGLEGSWSAAKIDGEAPCTNINVLANPCRTTVSDVALLLGRAGFLVTDRFHAYGQVGWGSARVKDELFFTGGALGTGEFGKARHNGLAFGGGVEFMFAPNWVIGVDYTRIDLNSKRHNSVSTFAPGFILPKDVDPDVNIVRGKLTYLFNWAGPVVARY
jgi:outer membrane immunogenic protein